MAEELNWVRVEGTDIFIALEQIQGKYLKRYVAWHKTQEGGIPQHSGRYSSRKEAQEYLRKAVELTILESFILPITKAICNL